MDGDVAEDVDFGEVDVPGPQQVEGVVLGQQGATGGYLREVRGEQLVRGGDIGVHLCLDALQLQLA